MTKIAIIQEGPEYLNLPKTIQKFKDIVFEINKSEVSLVAFGESWMTGYPIWLDCCHNINLWDSEPVKEVWAKTFQHSLELGSKEFNDLQKFIKDQQMAIVLGANEKISKGPGNGTIYNAVFTFAQDGRLLNHHRKLIPTHTERMVHGLGDANGLKAVELDFGRIGSLICWEHWMPLTRQAMHDEAEDIHFALWPQVKEMNRVASQHYAFEGRCIVVAIGQIMKASELPSELKHSFENTPETFVLNGGSCIYGPDGSELLMPQSVGQKSIIIEIPDLKLLVKEKMNLAVSGHYQRPDVFEFLIDKNRTFKDS